MFTGKEEIGKKISYGPAGARIRTKTKNKKYGGGYLWDYPIKANERFD